MKNMLPKEPQRCPRCLKMTLSFDPETKRVFCSACGYEQRMRT
ncbi:MAG: hypothetical protein NTW67_04300 [Candidatus Woesearchaeota archaeon]|nr:hypothetical protein [Candidatus Woesearchaeota archaeon]